MTNRPDVDLTCPPCPFCSKTAVLRVPADQLDAYRHGAFAQDAFPDMVPEMREMLISGTHPACWDAMFGGEPDVEPDTYVSESDNAYFSDRNEDRMFR